MPVAALARIVASARATTSVVMTRSEETRTTRPSRAAASITSRPTPAATSSLTVGGVASRSPPIAASSRSTSAERSWRATRCDVRRTVVVSRAVMPRSLRSVRSASTRAGSVGARAARRTPVTALRASVRAAPTSSGCSAWYVASASTTDACTVGTEGVRDAPLGDRDAAVRRGAGEGEDVVGSDRPALLDEQRGQRVARGGRARGQPGDGIVAGSRRRRDVEHGAARHGLSPAGLPEHEPVADVQHHRRGRRDPDERFAAGLELRRSVEAEARVDLRRADVQLERAARRDGTRAPADRAEARLEHARGAPRSGQGEHVAASEPIALDPDEVRRDARHRAGAVLALLVRLEGADPRSGAGGQQLDLVADRRGSRRRACPSPRFRRP